MTKACTFMPKLNCLRVFTTQTPTVEGQNERPTRAPLDAKGSIGCAAADEAIEPLASKGDPPGGTHWSAKATFGLQKSEFEEFRNGFCTCRFLASKIFK